MKKRLFGILLIICLVVCAFSVTAFADGETNTPVEVSTKAGLDAAIASAEAGDMILLTADIDYTGTSPLVIDKAITLDLGSKTLTTHGTYGGMQLKNGCTLKNGTLAHKGTVTAIKAWNVASIENLVIDVAFKAEGKTIGGIVIQEGTDVCISSIKNVTIKGEGLTNGIETYNCGNATANVIGSMENVTIDAKSTGMLISAPCGTATNCNIKGGVSGIEIWIKGTYSAKLNLVNCTVEGGAQAVYAHDEFSSNPDIVNNGTLELTADDKTEFTSENGAQLTQTIERAENVSIVGVVDPQIDVMNNTADEAGEGWSWIQDTKTLTLNGLDFSTPADSVILVPDDSTIVLVGENKIATESTEAKAIYVAGKATIIGDGSLTITSGKNAIYAEKADGDAGITIDGATITANGGITTADTCVNASLILKNADVNIERNSINIRNDNGTRGETGEAGTATISMDGSSLYTGPVFVGAHLSSNHSYTRTSAVFQMNESSIDVQGGGKSAMIYVWGDCGADVDIVDSNVKIWNSGWQYSDFDIQGGNDHYGVTGDAGVVLDVNIERSNLDMYGYRSGLTVKRYYSDAAAINFNMDESTISTMTKYGSSGISIDDSTFCGTTEKTITDSITFLTNDPGHSGTNMEVNATIYGNPTVHQNYTIVQQTGGTNDFSTVEYDFVLGENQTLMIAEGKTMTSAKAITLMPGAKIEGNYVGEVITSDTYKVITIGEGDDKVIFSVLADAIAVVSVSVEPADAVIVIKDAAGNVVDANEDGTYTLLIGETYSYTVSKSGYVSESGTMTAYAEEAEFVFELEKEPVYIPVAPVVKPVEKDEPCDGGLECPAFKFSDVDPDAWYHEAIDFALVEGLMNGVGGNKFNPGGSFTRAMMWTVLARQAGVDTDGGETWYSVGQEWSMANDVSDGSNPDGAITREQLVTMLWRYVGEPEGEADLSDYVDGDDVSDWAEEAMIWAVSIKVIGGRGNGILAPQGLATRSEVAQIFKNYFE